jgi:ribonuclease P protein component
MQLLTAVSPGRAGTRAGFIVKRKLGCACMRNLMKRRMREAYRDVKHRLGPGRDLVVSATAVLDYKAVRRNLEELLARSGAIENHGKPE